MGKFVVWMDGAEARVFELGETTIGEPTIDEATVRSPKHHIHRHPKDQTTRTHNHPDDEHRFFHDVGASFPGTGPILVVGPSVTKLRFLRYTQEHNPALATRIMGLETVDHPTDHQIVAYARHYFDPQTAPTG